MSRLAALGMLALAGCSTAPADTSRADRALAQATAGRTAGASQRCLDQSRVQNPQIVDRRTLIYRESGRRIWVNTLPAACPSLRTDSILIVRLFGTDMCDGDRFQARQPTDIIAGPVCRLGAFTPYDRPAD